MFLSQAPQERQQTFINSTDKYAIHEVASYRNLVGKSRSISMLWHQVSASSFHHLNDATEISAFEIVIDHVLSVSSGPPKKSTKQVKSITFFDVRTYQPNKIQSFFSLRAGLAQITRLWESLIYQGGFCDPFDIFRDFTRCNSLDDWWQRLAIIRAVIQLNLSVLNLASCSYAISSADIKYSLNDEHMINL